MEGRRGRSTNVPSRIDPSPPFPEPAPPAPRPPARRRVRSAAPPQQRQRIVSLCHTAALWDAMTPHAQPQVVSELSALARKTCEALVTQWAPIVKEVRARLHETSEGGPRRPPSAVLDDSTRRTLLGLDRPDARRALGRLDAWTAAVCAVDDDPAVRKFIVSGNTLIQGADHSQLDAHARSSANGCSAACPSISSSSSGGFSRSSSSVSTHSFAHSVSGAG
mgnify:CR=1 FL=1